MDIGMYNSYLEVDFGRMKESFRKVQAAAGRRGVIPVLKANAYGMNAVEVAGALKTEGARLFAVASSDEAEQLLREHPDIEVLVMGLVGEGALRRLIARNMPITLFSERQGDRIAEIAIDNRSEVKLRLRNSFPILLGPVNKLPEKGTLFMTVFNEIKNKNE